MRKFLYTAILLLCVSIYASSNVCIRHEKDHHPAGGSPGITPVEKPLATEREEQEEFSTFQFVKYLYL